MKTLISYLGSSMSLFYDYKLSEISKMIEESESKNILTDK